jgi:hypothetical protein
MPVAKVVYALGHITGPGLGGVLGKSCLAGGDVVDGPVPEGAGRSIRILDDHGEAPPLLRGVAPLQGR